MTEKFAYLSLISLQDIKLRDLVNFLVFKQFFIIEELKKKNIVIYFLMDKNKNRKNAT